MGSINIIKQLQSTALSSLGINLGSIKNSEKLLGTAGIKPGATGCKVRTLSIVLCGPHRRETLLTKSIVFTQPDCVHQGQLRLLIGTGVA